MTALQAMVIAVLQGATELFPVSSLGHAVILPRLLGWHLDQHGAAFLPFLVMLHLGTAAALLLYFWRDWWTLAQGNLGLVANGFLLLLGERLRTSAAGAEPRAIASLTPIDALTIGLWQSLALLPGISRSGATIVGGLLRGIDHAAAAHFSFLIATPIILAAALKEVPKLAHAGLPPGTFALAFAAALVAGAVAYASTAFLMRYFRGHDEWALNPFAYYCLAAGGLSVLWFVL